MVKILNMQINYMYVCPGYTVHIPPSVLGYALELRVVYELYILGNHSYLLHVLTINLTAPRVWYQLMVLIMFVIVLEHHAKLLCTDPILAGIYLECGEHRDFPSLEFQACYKIIHYYACS